MAEKHLAAAIARRFRGMSRDERIAKVRKLAAGSPEDAAFLRKTFPELYRQALRPTRRAAGARSGAAPRRARAAARR